jgi:hypothetical protein
MKKLLLTIALAAAGLGGLITSAQAHDHHCGGWYGGCYYGGPYCGGYYDNCWDNDGSCWYFYRHNDRDHDHGHRR